MDEADGVSVAGGWSGTYRPASSGARRWRRLAGDGVNGGASTLAAIVVNGGVSRGISRENGMAATSG